MVTALGVAQDADGVGMDALTHRRVIGAHWENPGVVAGLEVSGAAGLRYQASAGVAVCSTGGSDGSVEAYWPGGLTLEAVTAGDGAYPRIDTVYLLADTRAGGQVSLHVAQGTPSASPAHPVVPAGGLRLRDMTMPAGASATISASPMGSVDYAIPYGAKMGRIGYGSNTSSVLQDWSTKWWSQAPAETMMLATDRLVTVKFTWRASVDGEQVGSFYAMPVVDDQDMGDGLDECLVAHVWARQSVEWRMVLEGGRPHRVDVMAKPNLGRPRFTWRGLRTVEVIDEGVAR
ncbi:hypothetical protein BACT_1064 [Bifidobacterium actinocoloniiforme DSM 22766]|uniref:Uncharacterized protein n=1 Tax=Bifidobacterium actinocoloniiforme DSM 22766 TaxID=1437605 RepID=A0A086Z1G2_9BIFI|nr:hypothetical protein [Bifidobacterium actinocoloniiforme]KFI40362.1 hypothetical protein BACT_1064 [Bifidobacterium actinocoloniiforme DSM 22766]